MLFSIFNMFRFSNVTFMFLIFRKLVYLPATNTNWNQSRLTGALHLLLPILLLFNPRDKIHQAISKIRGTILHHNHMAVTKTNINKIHTRTKMVITIIIKVILEACPFRNMDGIKIGILIQTLMCKADLHNHQELSVHQIL